MKLYISIKKMTFEEDNIEHNIIYYVNDKEFYGYDLVMDLKDDDKFIKDTLEITYVKDRKGNDTKEIYDKSFVVTEKETFFSFPLYEIINNKIVPFNYKKYQYFSNHRRRFALDFKINRLYNKASEMKIHRKTLKYIMDTLNIEYPDFFKKYNEKLEEVIKKNPK